MQSISIDELKNIQKEILDDVVSFCKKNKIRYYLAYGTLLGAVRHKGYIPWDDDIDIHMPRPDYEKFIELYPSKESYNRIVTHELDRNYNMPFAKVFRKGTIVKELFYKQSVFGVYIDIFPLDGIKSKWQAYICGECKRFIFIKNAIINNSLTFSRKARLLITKFLLLPLSQHFILKIVRSISRKHKYDECETVCSLGSRAAVREILPRKVFDEHTTVEFEGCRYCAPKDCDKYLTALYGNYMQLPPEEKRISSHNSNAYWL